MAFLWPRSCPGDPRGDPWQQLTESWGGLCWSGRDLGQGNGVTGTENGCPCCCGDTAVPQKLFCCESRPVSCPFGKCPALGEKSKSFRPPRSYLNYNKSLKKNHKKKKKCIFLRQFLLQLCPIAPKDIFEPKPSFLSSRLGILKFRVISQLAAY